MANGKQGNPMKPSPYMREHSLHIRFLSKHSGDTIEEDPIVTGLTPTARIILVIACRNRQRLLSHAWQLWVNNTAVHHNYKQDVVTILSRVIPEDELRTELEIEIIFKWVLQNHHTDPTGIAYTLYMCNSKAAIIKAIQHFRLERYSPSLPIMLQGDFPRPEEGHYTILHGLVDIVIFPPDSPELLRLHTAKKHKHENEIIEILKTGKTIDTMLEGAGFGELSTITGMKRSASVRAHVDHTVDLIVIPQIALLGLLEHRRVFVPTRSGTGGVGFHDDANQSPNYPSAEVMDYLRQSGLIYKAAMIDVMEAARCMIKTQYTRGSILYQKHSPVNRIYIILYGEVLLDTRSYEEGFSRDNEPFQHLDVDKCYLLRSGSILGDEGMSGKNQYFEASAIVMSETAVFFEVTGYGITFLLNRLGIEKYSALVYKDIPVSLHNYSGVENKLESLNDDLILHSTFMSLRKAIAMQNPYRGKMVEIKQSYLLKEIEVDEKEQEGQLERSLKYHSSPSSPQPQKGSPMGKRFDGRNSSALTMASPMKLSMGPGYSPSSRLQSPAVNHSQRNQLHQLPSRLSSPSSGHGSKPSTPMLPSAHTPLGMMLSTNHKLLKSITRRERSPFPSRPHVSPPRTSHSPSQRSQTHILRINSPEHHELTTFETKKYSTQSNSFRLPPSRVGSPTTRDQRGGKGDSGSPPHPTRPYSRQSDKDAFFKTLEGARFKKVKVLKPAALHHVQSIYKLIKKREMRYMRLQATENVSAKAKRELLEQKLKRDATMGKTHHDIYRELAMKHSVGEEKYQRALAAYNGRREHESIEEETEAEHHAPNENPTGGLLEVATATVLNEYTESNLLSPPMSPSLNPKFRISASKPKIDQYYSYLEQKKQLPGSQWNEISPRGDQKQRVLLHSKSIMDRSKKEMFCRCSTIYTVGVETVKLFDKDGHGRVVIVKQKSVLSLDKDSIKKSSGTTSTARKYRSQNSYISKSPSVSHSIPHTIIKKTPLSPAVAKIDKILQAISSDSPQTDPTAQTKVVVPEHLWNTRYLRHQRPSSPHTIYRAGKVDKGELSREELLQMTNASLRLATVASMVDPSSSRELTPHELTTERTLASSSSSHQPIKDEFSNQKLIIHESGSLELKSVPTPIQSTSTPSSSVTKPNILQSWKNQIEKDPTSCQYMDGRKRASSQSRFRLGKGNSQRSDQDLIELKQWTDYCGQNTLQIKSGPLRSLPVLSNNGSHSLYWSKKIVPSDGEIINTDESLLRLSLQKLTNSTR